MQEVTLRERNSIFVVFWCMCMFLFCFPTGVGGGKVRWCSKCLLERVLLLELIWQMRDL